MSSEIRVNKINNRVGLGTVSFTDTGPVVSGIVTVTAGLKVTGGTSYFAGAIKAAGAITGTASTATKVTVSDESSDTSCNVLFSTAATGNVAPKTGSNLTFNSSSGALTATSFSGSGESLTNLTASQLIGALPSISGANLTNLPPSAPVGGASTNTVFFENDKEVAVNYQITSTKNAMSAGPIAINAGIAVTVPSGCAWTIV